jgi:hypothetical protein
MCRRDLRRPSPRATPRLPTPCSAMTLCRQSANISAGAPYGARAQRDGLLCQYLPRGTDSSRISQSYLNAIAVRLNQRPRKTSGVALTG